MPRAASVPRSEYPAILGLSEKDGLRTADIAARYGVVPRTVSIILAKARAAAGTAPPSAAGAAGAEAPSDAPSPARAPDGRREPPEDGPALPSGAVLPDRPPETPRAPRAAPPGIVPSLGGIRPRRPFSPVPKPGTVRSAPKAAYELLVRADGGDEASTPFRSLEELISSARGSLREAAASPEPVWFCVRRVPAEAAPE